MRKIIQCIVDKDSYFELKARFGRVAVTALARLGGRVVGFVANNPLSGQHLVIADVRDPPRRLAVLREHETPREPAELAFPVIGTADNRGHVSRKDGRQWLQSGRGPIMRDPK